MNMQSYLSDVLQDEETKKKLNSQDIEHMTEKMTKDIINQKISKAASTILENGQANNSSSILKSVTSLK
jgi:hypothetical protein